MLIHITINSDQLYLPWVKEGTPMNYSGIRIKATALTLPELLQQHKLTLTGAFTATTTEVTEGTPVNRPAAPATLRALKLSSPTPLCPGRELQPEVTKQDTHEIPTAKAQ